MSDYELGRTISCPSQNPGCLVASCLESDRSESCPRCPAVLSRLLCCRVTAHCRATGIEKKDLLGRSMRSCGPLCAASHGSAWTHSAGRPHHAEVKGFRGKCDRSSARELLQPLQHQGRRVRALSVNKGLGFLEWSGTLVPQGMLVGGVKEGWKIAWQLMVRELAPQDRSGAYVRQSYSFQTRLSDIKNEAGRYHLYVGNACPWCHRVMLAYVLRGLAPGEVSFTRLGSDPTKARRGGWIFTREEPDPVWGARDLWEVYDRASPGWRGRCTAPLLVDRIESRIISNESSDIVAVLNALRLPGCTGVELRHPGLKSEIDGLCDLIYADINNGVYKSGFATTQKAYDDAQERLFQALDKMEARLGEARFLLGDKFTQADLWLFPTISRFDAVYSGIFKCGRKLIRADYKNLQAWLRDVWQLQVPGRAMQVPDTLDIDAARVSYYESLFPVNPSGIVPAGPRAQDLMLDVPSERGPAAVSQACFS